MTTALDTVKWDAALNTSKIFTQSSLDAMFTPARLKNGALAYTGWNGHFGLGWFIDDYLGHRMINHGGTFITGFHAEISRFVDEKLTVIILTNRVLSDQWTIGLAIAGIYDPNLRPPFMLKAKKDGNPQRTQKLKQFLTGVADGSTESEQLTTGFRSQFNSDQKSDIAEFMKTLQSFSYVDCQNIEQRRIERIGSRISDICHYKARTQSSVLFVSFYLTAQNKIADIQIIRDDGK